MMDKERTGYLIRERKIRLRRVDLPRINSLIESARASVEFIRKLPITEQSATIIFREYYESIRQLGDALLWSLGYEPLSHDVSMEALKNVKIKESIRLQSLNRFRIARNNANYRGYRISIEQAEEISEFWKKCSKELVREIRITGK